MTLLRRPADDAIELVDDLSLRLVRRGAAASGGRAGTEGGAGNEARAELSLSFAGVWIAAELRSQSASEQIWARVGGVRDLLRERPGSISVSTETSRDPGRVGAIAMFCEILLGLRERAGSASEASSPRADFCLISSPLAFNAFSPAMLPKALYSSWEWPYSSRYRSEFLDDWRSDDGRPGV